MRRSIYFKLKNGFNTPYVSFEMENSHMKINGGDGNENHRYMLHIMLLDQLCVGWCCFYGSIHRIGSTVLVREGCFFGSLGLVNVWV